MVRQIFPKSFLSLLPPSLIPGSIPFSSSHFYQRQLAICANPPPPPKKTISAVGRREIGASPSRGCLVIVFLANVPFFCFACSGKCLFVLPFCKFQSPGSFLSSWLEKGEGGKVFVSCKRSQFNAKGKRASVHTLP